MDHQWHTAATFEWLPGPLLSWGNLFFSGNLDDIKHWTAGSMSMRVS
jgi:hypothetical protein